MMCLIESIKMKHDKRYSIMPCERLGMSDRMLGGERKCRNLCIIKLIKFSWHFALHKSVQFIPFETSVTQFCLVVFRPAIQR